MNKKQLIPLLLILLVAFLGLNLGTISAAPYRSYNYDYWEEVIPSPNPYLPERVIDVNQYVGDLRDIYICDGSKIWLADSGNNLIAVLDEAGELINIIKSFNTDRGSDKFNSPQGVFVSKDRVIYVADTGNQRIVKLNETGDFLGFIKLEQEQIDDAGIFTEGFRFRPRSIGKGVGDKLFVISSGVYDGIMEFSEEGIFNGFIGAPRVAPSLIDLFWSRMATEEQRARRKLFIPVEFSNLDINEKGFIYTTVSGSEDEDEAVKRLSPAGVDSLIRTGKVPLIGDVNFPSNLDPYSGPSTFVDITVRAHGIFSALDSKRGRVFTYDNYGNLLYVFGGSGNFAGMFQRPSAIDHLGDKIFVADRGKNTITVFRPTEYAQSIHDAIDYYENGHFEQSAEKWRQVLELNSSNEMAYSGIGRNYFLEQNFEEAMYYFQLGEDRENYSKAFNYYRSGIMTENANNIIMFIIALVIVIVLLVKLSVPQKIKAQISAATTRESTETRGKIKDVFHGVSYAGHIIFHPFDGFWDLKHEKRGNVISASVLLALVILSLLFSWFNTGFIFNTRDVRSVNIIRETLSILLTFGLWSIVNWGFTTLTDGKGSLKDIYIYSAYALTPIILIIVPLTIATNYMIIDESYFYYLFMSFSIIWSMGLLFFGTLVTHDYSLPKGVLSVIIIIIGIVVVAFLGLLFFMVIDRLIYFFIDLYHEIVYRI